MLRSFQARDGPRMAELVGANFPEEGELLRWRPGAFEAIVARVYRPHLRFLLWLFERLRHPIFKVFAIEADGQFVGGAILAYPARAGYISSVVVDGAYRGRGYGTQIVRACETAAARVGRPYVALDVLEVNAPARRLYAKLGYHLLRTQAYYVRDYDAVPGSPEPVPATVRPFVSRDAAALVPIANAMLPPSVAEVLPAHARQFTSVPLVAEGLRSETEAWVVDRGHGAEGFVRATVSAATESGHLTAPILAPELPDDVAHAAVRTAVDWLRGHQVRRVLCEMPNYNTAGVRALTAEGFREALLLQTLYHPLAR
jgi:ribosomal protein S18 acetylase RimI-like enzyme